MILQQQPARSAVYGVVTGNTTNVSVTVTAEDGSFYSVQAIVNQGQWKALLHPAPSGGNYTLTATASCMSEQVSAQLSNVAFGDVW